MARSASIVRKQRRDDDANVHQAVLLLPYFYSVWAPGSLYIYMGLDFSPQLNFSGNSLISYV